MDIKSLLKSVIGEQRLSYIKGTIFHYGCLINLTLRHESKLEYNKKRLKIHSIFSEGKYHVFRGYYDLDYMNQDGRRFLCHRLPINAQDNRDTKCEVGFYDLSTGTFDKIAETSAWCWQQGSRLRWIDQDRLIFNDVKENHYCARIYNCKSGKQEKIIESPLYDFTPDFKYGFTLNFSRLQRLRPGYGYDFFPDENENINAPSNDGIVRVDIASGENVLLYSLYDLAQQIEHGMEYIHYVNHISVAPDGEHFIFFHIYLKDGEKEWKTVMYVSDIRGQELVALEKHDRASHYCWIDNTHIMVTCRTDKGKEYYAIYDIIRRSKEILRIEELCVDGHPSKSIYKGSFITDTYPLKGSLQQIYRFYITDTHTETIASIYHDYRLRGEKRCDLHPSISKSYKLLSVDSTFQKHRRNVIIFDLISEEKNAES